MLRRIGLAAALVCLLVWTATPAQAAALHWQRNHGAPTAAYHCNTHPFYDVWGNYTADIEVCVVVSGHTWQPVIIIRNYTLDQPDVDNPVNLYQATSADPGVWYLVGNCGAEANLGNVEITMCFGPSTVQPSTTVQAKAVAVTVHDGHNSFDPVTMGSPSVSTGP